MAASPDPRANAGQPNEVPAPSGAPSSDAAFTVVLDTLRARLSETLGLDAHEVINRAITNLEEAREAITRLATQPAPPPGAPRPGSVEELNEEIEKEKLDPGA